MRWQSFWIAAVILGQTAAVLGSDPLDLDFTKAGWKLEAPYRSLNWTDGTKFPTGQQGKWLPPAIRMEKDGGSLWFGVPASEEVKDRVETKLLRDVPMEAARFHRSVFAFPWICRSCVMTIGLSSTNGISRHPRARRWRWSSSREQTTS